MKFLLSRLRLPVALVLALTACGCAETTKFDAAGDVHAFLISIRDGNQTGFDAHVDRLALKTQIRARLMAAAAKRVSGGDLAAFGLALARPLVDAAADQLIQPDVFRAVAEYLGYSAKTSIPNRLVIAQALRPLEDDRVCATRSRDGPCILVFRNEDGVWRLIGFEGDVGMLKPAKGG